MAKVQVKAKTKSTANAKSTATGVELPAGYTAIVGNRGVKWDYEAMPLLQGLVEAIREVEVGTGRNKRTAKVMSVRTDDGALYDVWESAALAEFFGKADEGDKVAIAFRGYLDVGRQQPMKDFVAGIAESKDRARR